MKFAPILFGLTLIACSCGQKNKTENVKKEDTTKYSLVADRTLDLGIDEGTSVHNYFYDVFTIRDQEFLGLVNKGKNSLQFYSITNGKLFREIKLEKKGPDGFPGLNAFTFLSPDSIFIVSLYADNLWLIDIEGKVKKKLNPLNQLQPLHNLGTGFYTGSKPLYSNGKLYIPACSELRTTSSTSFFDPDNKLEVEIDLKDERWKFMDVSYPPVYRGHRWKGDISRDLGKNGTLVYSFAADPDVKKYNLVNGVATSHRSKSIYIKEIKPLNSSDGEDASFKYAIETPKYSNIAYDKYNDVYYRFIKHQLPAINSATGEPNTFDDAAFSIMILDSSLNKIGETKVEDSKHHINSYFVSKDGLYISNTNLKNPDLKTDTLSFTLFKLREIK